MKSTRRLSDLLQTNTCIDQTKINYQNFLTTNRKDILLRYAPLASLFNVFGEQIMRFWDRRAPLLERLSSPNGLDLSRLKKDIQPWWNS